MTTLVTGASGLLGSAVARELRARGRDVRTFQRRPSGIGDPAGRDADRLGSNIDELGSNVDELGSITDELGSITDELGSITDDAAVARAVDGVDEVVHLAARVSLAGDPAEFRAVNVHGTARLLAAAASAGASRFVFVSSPSVAHSGASISGAGADPADPVRARGEYARTKAMAELRALAADRPGFAVVAVRPHLVWGPGDAQLVGRIVDRARSGRLPLLDHGRALIDTLYIDNAATGIAQALDRADAVHGRSYVLTNGEPRPVAELLAGICRAAGVPAPHRSVPAGLATAAGSVIERAWRLHPGADEPPMTRFLAEQLSTSHWFDQRRTRAELAWDPAVSLDEGFARLAAWYAARPR